MKSNGKVKRDFIYMGDVANVSSNLLKIDATNAIYNLSSNYSFDIEYLANVVKTVYEKKYGRKIKIYINENDKNVYNNIEVKNDKLRSLLKFDLNDMMFREVESTFTLLEKTNE